MYNHAGAEYQCPFCAFVAGVETEYNKLSDIVYQDDDVCAFVSPKWWVNNPGNVLLIPKKHIEHVYDMDDELLAKIHIVSKRVALAMKESYGCDGTMFRQHNEPAGSQEVFHYHLHVFPRWNGDDFYQNLESSRYVSDVERLPYTQKLQEALKV